MLWPMLQAPYYGLGVIIVAVASAAAAQQGSVDEFRTNSPKSSEETATPASSGWSSPPPADSQPRTTPPAPSDAAPSPQPAGNANYGSTPPSAPGPAYSNANSPNSNYGSSQRSEPAQPKPNDEQNADGAHSKSELPTMSVRIDPLNWLLFGRLGFELECQVWKFISIELVPMFVVNDQPPALNLNLSGLPNTLYQKSAGIGALAGTSIGAGFWFNGKPMEGYVLRAELTDYVINYDSRDPTSGPIDHVQYVDRQFQVLIGSHSKWGPVTLAGTFGIGTMLNRQNRCFTGNTVATASTSGCPNNKELSIAATNRDPVNGVPMTVVNLHDWTYPITLNMRISLGVVF
jgi:hypothetical protein